ncbi:MAG: transcriptional repressor [Spirochaetaceae bacterium]|nr:transcriptional repressor [Spirochaetaceae bacterium]
MERQTRQRDAIQAVIESYDRPLSPTEICEAAREHLPRLGIATVYRAIRDLVESEWLRTVEIPGAPARYERAGKPHHHHFLCRTCDGLWEVDDCLSEVDALAPAGFVTEGHDITLYGLCSDCRSEDAG